MTSGIETRGAVRAVRRAEWPANPTRIRAAGHVLAMAAELAFTQLGIPGALVCCAYLMDRWGTRVPRAAVWRREAIHPRHVASASSPDACDHERS